MWFFMQMKSLLKSVMIAAGIVFWCAPCFSAYLIELKSGAQFITGDYWEEDQKIWFNQSGGFVGVEKQLVKEIRESDIADLIREAASNQSPLRETGPVAGKAASVPKHPQEAPPAQISSLPPPAAAPTKDAEIEKEFDSLKHRVTNADPLEKPELITLAKDMTAFRNRVLKKNLGHVYTDRLLELSGMFDRIEKLIKSKG
jgi:hypothetical protein